MISEASLFPSFVILGDEKFNRQMKRRLGALGYSSFRSVNETDPAQSLRSNRNSVLMIGLDSCSAAICDLLESLENLSPPIMAILVVERPDLSHVKGFVEQYNCEVLFNDESFSDLLPALIGRNTFRARKLHHLFSEMDRLRQEVLDVSEREQRRIGRDLHDTVCQLLASAAMKVHALQRTLADRSIDVKSETTHISELIGDAIDQTRSAIHGIFLADSKFLSLEAELAKLAAAVSTDSGILCELISSCETPIEDIEVVHQLFRIAQEALGNAVKHAKAKRITICLAHKEDHIALEIADDGTGYDASDLDGNGLGLRIMIHRAHAIGGEIDYRSQPGKGTRVSCRISWHKPFEESRKFDDTVDHPVEQRKD